jgi:hypothetical protein
VVGHGVDLGVRVSDGEHRGGFWRTLPGILSAVAACITAVTGLVIGVSDVGLFGSDGERQSAPPQATATVERRQPERETADAVAGTWSGRVKQGRSNVFRLQLTIAKDCEVEETCGSISVSHVPCFGDLSFKAVAGERYEFSVDHFSADSGKACTPGAGEYLTPHGDDALLYTTGYDASIRGILHPPR